jgi:hypothetical protein
MVVKLVLSCNYVPGRRQEYLEWVKKIVPTLIAPEELKKLSAWENWTPGSPHRVIEVEFEDSKALEKYASRPEIRKISQEEWRDISSDHDAKIYVLIYEKVK